MQGVPLPLLRIKPTWWKTDVVVIYHTHITKGTRYLTPFSITERMCYPDGEDALQRQLHSSRRIYFQDITRIDEEVPAGSQSLDPRAGQHQFKVLSTYGNVVKFWVPSTQVGHIRAVLKRQSSERYRSREFKRRGCLGPIVILLSLLLLGVGPLVYDDPLPRILICGLAVAGMIGGCFLLMQRRGSWKEATEEGTDSPKKNDPLGTKASRRKSRPATNRDPFRSLWLGWLLKIAGICYWIAIASPLTDGLTEFIEKAHASTSAGPIWLLVWSPSALLIYWGYRFCQFPYSPKNSADPRKPILFLRPFEDDASTSLQPPGMLAKIAGIRSDGLLSPYQWKSSQSETGRVMLSDYLFNSNPIRLLRMIFDRDVATCEESLVRFFEGYGPVVAIGKPGEFLATPGARRVYVADDQWQRTVLTAMGVAQAIVLQPGRSAGVQWELEQIRRSADPCRVLLCLVSFWRNPQAYEELQVVFRSATGQELPRLVPFLLRPAFVYFDHQWKPQLQIVSNTCPLLWPLIGNAVDLQYTLQTFLQGVHGGEREPPRKPQWCDGLGPAIISFLAVFFAFFVAWAPIWVVHRFANSIVTPHVNSSSSSGNNLTVHGSSHEQRIRQTVASSPWIRLHGRTVWYSFEIPESLIKLKPENPIVEFFYKSPDGQFHVQVLAYKDREDTSTLAMQRLEKNTDPRVQEIRLEGTRTVTVANVDWAEARIFTRINDIMSIREISRIMSDDRGTIAIILHIDSRGENTYNMIAERILASFQVAR